VAHQEIDIARPKDNEKNTGFTWEERKWMTRFFKPGLHRYLSGFCPPGGHYTWWTYRFKARERNIGWRVDYFVISSELRDRLLGAEILSQVEGSDHAPIKLILAPAEKLAT